MENLLIAFAILLLISSFMLLLCSAFLDDFDIGGFVNGLLSIIFSILVLVYILNLSEIKELHCIDMNGNELIAESCSDNMSCVVEGKTIKVNEYWEVIKDE